jgi:hypothetical protein
VNPTIRATFPNQQKMNDIEHMAWTISCNYQRTLHPIYINHINRIEQYKYKQQLYIYRRVMDMHSRTQEVIDTTSPTKTNDGTTDIKSNHDETVPTLDPPPSTTGPLLIQDDNSNRNQKRSRVIVPKPSAVHISILKIQS